MPSRSEKTPVCGRGVSPFVKTGKASFAVLENDVNADVLIIGGGMAGLLVAYGLLEKGVEPVICEMNAVGGCSTAFAPPYLLPHADVTMGGLTKKYGHEEAKVTFGELRDTVPYAKEIVKTVGGGCGFTLRDSFLFAESDSRKEALNEEYRLRKYSGFPCEKLSQGDCEEAFSFRAWGGIYETQAAAEINAPLFCESVGEYLSVKGVEIYEYSPVTELFRTASGSSATVAEGKALIKAKTVIDCRGLRQRSSALKNSTVYAAVSPPQNEFYGWKNRCIIRTFKPSPIIACTTCDNRLYTEGFPNKRLLGNLSAEYSFGRLENTVERMFFGTEGEGPSRFYERVYSRSPDGLPYMGRAAENDSLYRVYASGRCGLTAALLASKLIPAAITGDKAAQKRLREYEVF